VTPTREQLEEWIAWVHDQTDVLSLLDRPGRTLEEWLYTQLDNSDVKPLRDQDLFREYRNVLWFDDDKA
jgi:hypothetical protein